MAVAAASPPAVVPTAVSGEETSPAPAHTDLGDVCAAAAQAGPPSPAPTDVSAAGAIVWRATVDPASGDTYFYDEATEVSVWGGS